MYSPEEIAAEHLDDFRVFLRQVWDHLGLPAPTPIQNEMAQYLQHGPRRLIVSAFRGVGKSYITIAFVLYSLFLDPQLKILVVSANEQLAKDFILLCRQLIDSMPLLQHLKPKQGRRDNAFAFDVGPATWSKNPSVKAAGITGQITGSRASIIVPDDIEVPKNSHTHVLRERIATLIKEFDAVLLPGGRVLYLGTPQNESSIYMKLLARGYSMRVWPIEVPARLDIYQGRLAPSILKLAETQPAHTPTEPSRFPVSEIDERKASYGSAGFPLQFMLDTAPADADRTPLKTRDLMIHDVDATHGHVKLTWSSSDVIQNLASGGFEGDYYVTPSWKSEEVSTWQGTVCAIDPSAKGQDETAYAIVRYLSGQLYLIESGGFTDGFAEATLRKLAVAIVSNRCNAWIAERNYGGGMFNQLLKPVILQVAEELKTPGASEDVEYDAWSSSQKEQRILDTLEPVIKSHRLIVDRRVIEKDLIQQERHEKFSLIWQLTRLSRQRGCLPNEDRLEAVSMAVSYWTEKMNRDKDKAVESFRRDKMDEALRQFRTNTLITGGRRRTGSVSGKPRYSWRPPRA